MRPNFPHCARKNPHFHKILHDKGSGKNNSFPPEICKIGAPWPLQPAAPTKTFLVEEHLMWLQRRHLPNKYLYSSEKWGFEPGDKNPTEEHTKHTMPVLSLRFEILIHHIITPAREKKTSISPQRGHVSMEKQRILAHNRSVWRDRGSKGSKARLKKTFFFSFFCEGGGGVVDL